MTTQPERIDDALNHAQPQHESQDRAVHRISAAKRRAASDAARLDRAEVSLDAALKRTRDGHVLHGQRRAQPHERGNLLIQRSRVAKYGQGLLDLIGHISQRLQNLFVGRTHGSEGVLLLGHESSISSRVETGLDA